MQCGLFKRIWNLFEGEFWKGLKIPAGDAIEPYKLSLILVRAQKIEM